MATITTSARQAYSAGSTTSTAWIGFSYSTVRTVRFTFTTPSTGATGLSFSFVCAKSGTEDRNLRWYVTDSSSSHASASGTGVAYTGTFNCSYNSSLYQYTFTSIQNNALKLLPNKTYYLWLFPGHSTYNAIMSLNNSSLTLTTSGSYQQYSLSISTSNATVSVTRSGSTLSNGAAIFTGDVLTISYSAPAGYEVTATVNGSAFQSGKTHTVAGNVSVVCTAVLSKFRLSVSAGPGAVIEITNTGSSAKLYDGSDIYKGDVLKIVFAAAPDYELTAHTVNGAVFTSGNTITVSGDITVAATAVFVGKTVIGGANIAGGTEYLPQSCYIGSDGLVYEPWIVVDGEWARY